MPASAPLIEIECIPVLLPQEIFIEVNMATYIPLGKNPTSPDERQELIAKRVEMEESLSQLEVNYVQKKIIELLISQKGYSKDDLEVNKEFRIELADAFFNVKADIAIMLDGRISMVVKCVINSLESWERHSIAFCRVVESYQIPFAVVTDAETAKLFDAAEGKLISEGMNSIPSREEVLRMIEDVRPLVCSSDRIEKAKRILYAFDAITCPAGFTKQQI